MQDSTPNALDDDQLESLTARLTPKQIGWLQAKAGEKNVSVDHVLRSVLSAQMRQETQSLSDSESSGRRSADAAAAPPSRSSSSPNTSSSDIPTDRPPSGGDSVGEDSPGPASSEAADDTPSIVESLRSASERLQNLTEEEVESGGESGNQNTGDLAESAQDTLDRLRSRLGRTGSDEEDESVLTDNQAPSMFDLMEDEDG